MKSGLGDWSGWGGWGNNDFPVVGDEGVNPTHEPDEGAAGKEGDKIGEGVADDFEQAFDPVFNFAGVGVDERNFVDGALAVDKGAGGVFGVQEGLVGGTAGRVQHARFCEGVRIELAHGAFGVVEDEVVVEGAHIFGFCRTNLYIVSELSKLIETNFMRFEIPFDASVCTAKNETSFKLQHRKTLRRARLAPVFAAALLLLAWLETLGGSRLDFVGYFALSYGILLLYVAAMNFYVYRKRQKAFRNSLAAVVKRRMDANSIKVYVFEEKYFGIQELLYEFRYTWEAFKYYKVAERTLFLYLRESTNEEDFLTITETELGYENSKTVLSFVGTKLKQQG